MVDVMVFQTCLSVWFHRQFDCSLQSSTSKFIGIKLRRFPSRGRPAIQMWQFHFQDCGLQLIEAEIAANELMLVTRFHPVLPANTQSIRELIVSAYDQSSIAGRAEIFRRIETETTGVAHRSGFSGLLFHRKFCANRLLCDF